MTARRFFVCTTFPLLLAAPAAAQTYKLAEPAAAGSCVNCDVQTRVSGSLLIPRGDRLAPASLRVANRHTVSQRVLKADAGRATETACFYTLAETQARFGGGGLTHGLPDGRRLVVKRRTPAGTLSYCPDGPLGREHLELIDDHFGLIDLPGLLPNAEVAVGQSWKPAGDVVRGLLALDGLNEHTVAVTLAGVDGGVAQLDVAGEVNGVEAGSLATVAMKGRVEFDLKQRLITSATWTLKDKREAGPVGPGLEAESAVIVKRTRPAAVPPGLTDDKLKAIPRGEVPGLLTRLVHADPRGRFQLVYPRQWHVVSAAASYLVMRLMTRDGLIAQATVAPWDKAAAGGHLTPAQVRDAANRAADWTPAQELGEGVVATDGAYVYRLAQAGSLHDVAVVRRVYLVAGPNGDQALVTFTMKPAKAAKLGTADIELVQSLSFPPAK